MFRSCGFHGPGDRRGISALTLFCRCQRCTGCRISSDSFSACYWTLAFWPGPRYTKPVGLASRCSGLTATAGTTHYCEGCVDALRRAAYSILWRAPPRLYIPALWPAPQLLILSRFVCFACVCLQVMTAALYPNVARSVPLEGHMTLQPSGGAATK